MDKILSGAVSVTSGKNSTELMNRMNEFIDGMLNYFALTVYCLASDNLDSFLQVLLSKVRTSRFAGLTARKSISHMQTSLNRDVTYPSAS